jgi:hypothetical protein
MTLKELIKQELLNAGLQVATAVRITIDGAETLVIASYSDPALDREVADGSRIKLELVQWAKAGYSGSIVDQLLANPIRIDPQIAREIAESPEFSLLEF